MAKGTQRFAVHRPLDEVHRYLSDPARVGGCLAFVQATERGDTSIRWRLKSPMSSITRTPWFDLEFRIGDHDIHWHGRGAHLETAGHLRLVPQGPTETGVEFALEMVGLGPMALVIEPLASVQIESQMGYFADCLRAQFETKEQ